MFVQEGFVLPFTLGKCLGRFFHACLLTETSLRRVPMLSREKKHKFVWTATEKKASAYTFRLLDMLVACTKTFIIVMTLCQATVRGENNLVQNRSIMKTTTSPIGGVRMSIQIHSQSIVTCYVLLS